MAYNTNRISKAAFRNSLSAKMKRIAPALILLVGLGRRAECAMVYDFDAVSFLVAAESQCLRYQLL